IARENLATLMNYDPVFMIPSEPMELLFVQVDSVESDPGYLYWQNAGLMQGEELKAEKNMLLPDISLGYFNGTNRYTGAQHYQGFEVGLGIPLFFGEQRAKVNAKKYAIQATGNLQNHYSLQYNNRVRELKAGLKKYEEAIKNYEHTGKNLAAELIRSSKLSYLAGEIDFFRFAISVDRAVQIEINQLENLYNYNDLVLEINYLTLEN
ncbi:MAG: TolC family protein, partial [Bacteroides sp.]|nr:TolC family protein [Bacteroides sp.]